MVRVASSCKKMVTPCSMFTIDEHHAKEALQGLVGRIAVSTQLCYPSMFFLCLGVKLVWLELEN